MKIHLKTYETWFFFRSAIISIAPLFATIALNAQEGQEAMDTLFGSKRDVVTAKVMSIANGKVHVKRPVPFGLRAHDAVLDTRSSF